MKRLSALLLVLFGCWSVSCDGGSYQYRTEYVFLAPTTYYNDYLTVVTAPQSSVQLDGAMIDLTDATPIPGSNQVYKHIVIDDGPHSLQSSHPLGILVFAFDDYVSYAFTGGLNLIKGQ